MEQLPPQNPGPVEDLTPGDRLRAVSQHGIADNMVDSSATSYSVVAPSDIGSGTATVNTKQNLSQKKLMTEPELKAALIARNADPTKKTDDPLTKDIKDLLNVDEDVKLLSENTRELEAIIKDFAGILSNSCLGQNLYRDFDHFRSRINKWLPAHKLFTLTDDDFQFDRDTSSGSNEGVLQRILLTSIIDRWRLNKMFTFSCEDQWNSNSQNALPVKDGITTKIPGLKADLVLSFRFESFTGTGDPGDPVLPTEFVKYACPDSCGDRCFPFVFIEAKRGEKGRKGAYCSILQKYVYGLAGSMEHL